MHDEDTVADLRTQVRRAQDRYESLVRLEEEHPDVEWILDGIDRARVELSSAQHALQAALEPPPPPVISTPVPPPPATSPAPDPATLRWPKQARFRDCAQFRAELEQALARLVTDPVGAFTRETIARALGKCSPDTLDNRCRDCQVDLSAEIARAQRSTG